MRIPIFSHTLQIGPYEGRSFTYTESYEPSDPKQAEYGRLFFVIEADVHPELGSELQKTIINTVKETYFADLTEDPYTGLENALQAANDALANLHVKGVDDWVGNLNAIIAVLADTTLHLTQTGGGGLYLVRGESATNISGGLSPESSELTGDKTFHNISSGTLLQGDHLLFISNDNYSSVADRDLVQAIKLTPFNDRSKLSQKLGSLNLSGTPVDMLVVQIGSGIRSIGDDSGDEISEDIAREVTSAVSSGMSQAKSLFTQLKNKLMKNRPASDINSTDGDLYGSGRLGRDSSKLGNTFQLLKDNSMKNLDRLFNRRLSTLHVSSGANKKRFATWAIIIVIIIGGSYWLLQARKASVTHRQMTESLQEIRDGKGIAKTRSIYEPESAKSLLVSLKKKAERIVDESNDSSLREDALAEIEDLSNLLDRVDNVYRIPVPKVAYDLSVERPSIKARGLFALDGQLFAFDQNALYKLLLDQIDTRKVSVGQQEDIEVIDADAFTQEQEIVLLTKDNGVIEYKDGTFAFGVSQDTTWNPGIALTDYDNLRLVYVLDSKNSEIWKYTRSRAGFESPSRKNISEQDLSTAVDFAIDGAIYVLKADGTVVKYFDDKLSPFEFTGLTEPLSNPTKVWADTDLDAGFLYFLDTGNRRVVVTGKGGEYIAQYVFPTAAKLTDLYVDDVRDLLYVLEEDGKIYEVEVMHY